MFNENFFWSQPKPDINAVLWNADYLNHDYPNCQLTKSVCNQGVQTVAALAKPAHAVVPVCSSLFQAIIIT
jgi:hypothetical protein